MMYVRQKSTGLTALARKVSNGLILIQFDKFEHPQSHGWHLYPRNHFKRK